MTELLSNSPSWHDAGREALQECDSDDEEAMFESRYEVVDRNPIGSGAFSKVYKAIGPDGKYVAMKMLTLDVAELADGLPASLIRQIGLLREMQEQENVVRLLDMHLSPTKQLLVFEFLEYDLRGFMRAMDNSLPGDVVRCLSLQLFRGINACHCQRILHRSIAPQNLLIGKQGSVRDLTLKISDFSDARTICIPSLGASASPRYTQDIVTVWYRAPEMLLGSATYGCPIDLWSAGCVLAEMVSGAPLFPGDSEIDTMFKIFQRLGTPTETIWPELKLLPLFKASFPQWHGQGWTSLASASEKMGPHGIGLLGLIMQYDPSERLSARQAANHLYFSM